MLWSQVISVTSSASCSHICRYNIDYSLGLNFSPTSEAKIHIVDWRFPNACDVVSVAVFISWARQHSLAAGVDSTRYLAILLAGSISDNYTYSKCSYWILVSCSQMNPTVMGCMAGSVLLRKAASLAFASKRRSTLASDIIELLGRR